MEEYLYFRILRGIENSNKRKVSFIGNLKKEIFEKIEKTIETLSEKIAQKIGELNETQPQAVILIGGGSLVPGLKEKIAEKVPEVAQKAKELVDKWVAEYQK